MLGTDRAHPNKKDLQTVQLVGVNVLQASPPKPREATTPFAACVPEGRDVRELAGPDVQIIAPTIEVSAPLEIETEVVNKDLKARTLKFTVPLAPCVPEEMDAREVAGPDVELTAPTIEFFALPGIENTNIRIYHTFSTMCA